jgi:two-component system, LytTR family, response regulator
MFSNWIEIGRMIGKSIYKAVIIEDEPESLNLLLNLIKENGKVEVTGTTMDPFMAVSLICRENPDLVFMDIRMPARNGFQIIDDLHRNMPRLPRIVFITAYDEFAVKAFEYAAFDYLLKPVESDRLNETILRALDDRSSVSHQQYNLLADSYKKLLFKSAKGMVIIDPEEVIYINADGNYSVFHLSENRTETVTSQLHKVEEQLPANKFFRISRSDIINLDCLKKINSRQSWCLLRNGNLEYRIEIPHNRIRELIEKISSR